MSLQEKTLFFQFPHRIACQFPDIPAKNQPKKCREVVRKCLEILNLKSENLLKSKPIYLLFVGWFDNTNSCRLNGIPTKIRSVRYRCRKCLEMLESQREMSANLEFEVGRKCQKYQEMLRNVRIFCWGWAFSSRGHHKTKILKQLRKTEILVRF